MRTTLTLYRKESDLTSFGLSAAPGERIVETRETWECDQTGPAGMSHKLIEQVMTGRVFEIDVNPDMGGAKPDYEYVIVYRAEDLVPILLRRIDV